MADTLNEASSTLKNGLVSQSELTYEVPDNAPDFDINAAANDFIDNLVAEQEPVYEGDPDDAGGEDSPEQSIEEEQPKDEGGAEDDLEGEDPKLARGISRLVARELAAKERESAAEARERAANERLAELKKYEGLKSTVELAEMLDIDPIGAFKAMGKDPDTILKLSLTQQLGDQAPEHLKAFAREAETKREIAQLKAQLAQQNQARAAQEYFNTILSGAREYVSGFDKEVKPGKKVGDSTPTLTLVAKADPDYARDEIMEEIVAEARRKAAEDPNGEPLSYDEAAKRVESRLSRLAKLLNGPEGTNNAAAKNAMKPKVTAPPTTKPAAKPIAPPWLRNPDSVEEQGLREAMRIYEQEEAKRKMRR